MEENNLTLQNAKMSRNHADLHSSFPARALQEALCMGAGRREGGKNFQTKTYFICNLWIFSLWHSIWMPWTAKRCIPERKKTDLATNAWDRKLGAVFQTWLPNSLTVLPWGGEVYASSPHPRKSIKCRGRDAVPVSRPRP